MSTEPPLRLGLAGAGMIATYGYGVLPNLGVLAGRVDVVAICDLAPGRAASVASEFGIGHHFADLDDMLRNADLDAVLNLTPIPAHAETSMHVLAAGKHLITEKPLATTLEDAGKILTSAEDAGLVVVCSPPTMIMPTRIEARRLVRSGAIGRVCFARVRGSHQGPAARNWPADPTWFYQAGSGPLFDMGVYALAEITGILGPACRVSAMSGITQPSRVVRGGPFDGVVIPVTENDNTMIMLDFGDSVFAMVDATFNVSASRSPGLEIYGSEGTLAHFETGTSSGRDARIEVYRMPADGGTGSWEDVDMSGYAERIKRCSALKRAVLVDHLLECLDTGTEPTLSARHGLHVLEIMLAAQESVRTGEVQAISSVF